MENGKVGLVTLFGDDFGSILQAYATYNAGDKFEKTLINSM